MANSVLEYSSDLHASSRIHRFAASLRRNPVTVTLGVLGAVVIACLLVGLIRSGGSWETIVVEVLSWFLLTAAGLILLWPYLQGRRTIAIICAVLAGIATQLLVPTSWGLTGVLLRALGWITPAAAAFLLLMLLDWAFERLMENNYKTILVGRYLRKRRIAWVSLIAVMLCTTMVLVVISVMGGWLRMFRDQFHGISGDVIVQGRSMLGFPYYEEMIRRIEALPEVKHAAPVLRTYGLININNQIRNGVQVMGYPPDIGLVNNFTQSLDLLKGRNPLTFSLHPDRTYQPPPGYGGQRDVRTWDGMVVGAGVIGIRKDRNGNLIRPPDDLLLSAFADLTVLPLSPESTNIDLQGKARNFYWLIDTSRTKVYLYDSNTVYVPFKTLQRDMLMDAQDGQPARTSDIQIALKPGADLLAAREKINQIVDEVAAEKIIDYRYPYAVRTWEETHATFIGAVEKEKVLVTFLFGIISIVAIFLIFCIFYMIVVEKTKDIGIVKSVGATSSGVAGIFLGYGMAIGVVGGFLGLLVGWLIVHYINQLHDWLGRALGVQVWNPEVYLFDTIPNTMNPREVTIIVGVAILASILGALVPAIRAARMHPVEALRWE